jgi:hypothetical protein
MVTMTCCNTRYATVEDTLQHECGKGMRVITLVYPGMPHPNSGPVVYVYDPTEFTDSEALHELLTQYDPGNTYSVMFKDE